MEKYQFLWTTLLVVLFLLSFVNGKNIVKNDHFENDTNHIKYDWENHKHNVNGKSNTKSFYGNESIGFELLFTSNLQEFNEKEIFFEKPLPKWLQGSLVKNGPSRFEFGHRNVTHGFDGYAKLRKIRFHRDGHVTFSSRFVESESYRKSMKNDDIAPYMLFQQPHPKFNILQKFEEFVHSLDNMNVNIYQFGKDHVVLQDIWNLYTVNISTLSTKQKIFPPVPNEWRMESNISPPPSTSHPMPEYGTENLITFANNLHLEGATLKIVRIKSTENRELIAEFETEKGHYMHCFGMTKNYAVIMAHPMYMEIPSLLASFEPASAIKWNGDDPMLIYVVNIHTGAVQKLQTKARFLLHFVNGYEVDNSTLVLDFTTFDDGTLMQVFEMDTLLHPDKRDSFPLEKLTLRRYTIHLGPGSVRATPFPNTEGLAFVNQMDLPKINDHFLYRPYCFTYGLTLKADDRSFGNFKLIKKNVCNYHDDKFWYKPNHYPGEPVFIPRPNSLGEDDGILLNVILDGVKQISYVAIFDPKTMELVNKAYLPSAEPFFFHGRFFDEV